MTDQLLELHVKEVFYPTKNTIYCEYGPSVSILQVTHSVPSGNKLP